MLTPVTALLRERAADTPDAPAVQLDDGTALTFGAWAGRAAAVAGHLRARGVRTGDRVAVSAGPEGWLDHVVALLGVMGAGGVAVPVPHSLPDDLVARVLAECEPVGQLWIGRPRPGTGWTLEVAEAAAGEHVGELPDPGPDDPAQILYTAGTTGAPRAVVATHANLACGLPPARPRAFAHSRHAVYAFPPGSEAAQSALFTGLVARPVTVLVRRFAAEAFCALAARLRAGSLFLAPSMAAELVRTGALGRHDLSAVVHVGCTGAPLAARTAVALAAALPGATLVDTYTTTEAAPAGTAAVHDPGCPAGVGGPLYPGGLRVTGPDGHALPAGEPGAVWLRAPGPPRRYWRDGPATRRTVVDGWVRTGDVGRIDAAGALHLLDREADVVVAGGHDVPTLPVERALLEHGDVEDVAVLGVPGGEGTRLVAAVVTRAALEPAAMSGFLAGRLSPHELPDRFVRLPVLPRDGCGRVRKRELATALAAPATRPDRRAGAERVRTHHAVEQALALLWREVLGGPAPGPDADFLSAGGDSLTATRLAESVRSAFGVTVPAALALDRPVLRDQARRVTHLICDVGAPAVRVPAPRRSGPVDLPPWPMQEHLWNWTWRTGTPRLVPPVVEALRVHEKVDPVVLFRALDVLVGRHDALRTVLHAGAGGLRQAVRPDARLPLRVVSPPSDVDREAWTRAEIEHEWRTPFDPSSAPLARVLLVRLGRAECVLTLVVDRLVGDSASAAILLHELGRLYGPLRAGLPSPLPPVGPSAAALVESEVAEHDRTLPYWRDRLAGAPAHPGAPRDLARVGGHEHGEWTGELRPEVVAALPAAAAALGATPFVLLFAAWLAILPDVTGSTDVVVATPMSGRAGRGRADVVGCLARDALLRVEVSGASTARELVARARRATVGAVDHQLHPFETVREPVPHVARFTVEDGPLFLPGLRSERFELARVPSAELDPADGVDLRVPHLLVRREPDRWRVTVLGNALVVAPRARSLLGGFADALCRVVTRPDDPVVPAPSVRG